MLDSNHHMTLNFFETIFGMIFFKNLPCIQKAFIGIISYYYKNLS